MVEGPSKGVYGMSEINKDGLQKLREPFPPESIGQLPKPLRKDAQKGRCQECGGWHGLPAIHLDFVGHADLTERFLDVDPEWSWKPMAQTPDGLPIFDGNGGLWIWLTICGVTRPAYGDAQGKSGGDAIKEAIGDALRNGGMRFGCALGLWRKSDSKITHASNQEPAKPSKPVSDADVKRGELKKYATREGWDLRAVAEKFPGDLRSASADEVEAFMVALETGVVTLD